MLELAATGSSDPALKARAVLVATDGLIHDGADIQAAVLDFVLRHGDRHGRSLRDLLAARRDGIAVSLRGRLELRLGTEDEAAPKPALDGNDLAALQSRAAALDPRLAALAGVSEALAVVRGERLERPALKFDGTEIPRLDPSRRLEPIDDLDTLIELCSRLIENHEPFDDIDRCVDAISRLCADRPDDFKVRTAPLAARVQNLLDAPAGMANYLVHYFALVVRGWLTGEVSDPRPFDGYRALEHFLSVWAGALARRAARASQRPCSPPPRTLADGSTRALCCALSRAQPALLRRRAGGLDLGDSSPCPRSPGRGSGRRARPGRRTGGSDPSRAGAEGETIGPSAALWAAAARARSPWSDDAAVEARHPGLGPDAGRAAAYLLGGEKTMRGRASTVDLEIDREPPAPADNRGLADLPIVALHTTSWLIGNQWPSPASLWPVALESFCACGRTNW